MAAVRGFSRRMAMTGGLFGAAAGVDYWNDSVVTRSLRTGWCVMRVTALYKLWWDPKSMDDVHATHRQAAAAIVDTLQTNEGLYIKFGQALSTMNHIFPPEYTEALKVMLDDAPAVDFGAVKATIESSYGRPLRDVFLSFDEAPVATASIAQVHRARMRGPEGPVDVAVKVLKPKIAHQIYWDLLVHDWVIHFVEWAFEIPCVWTAETIRKNLTSEIDFKREASNINCARELLRHRADLHIPPVMSVAPRVLVTEWVDAVKLADVETVQARYDVTAAMSTLFETFGDLIFKHGFIHADPHPANVMVRRKDGAQQVVLIDWGLCVPTGKAFRVQYAKLFECIFTHDMAGVKEVCQEWGIPNGELFASIQIQKPVNTATPVSKESLSVTEVARFQSELKDNLAHMLQDDTKIPRELVFVGRCMNILRSLNKQYGAPVNRINILARRAVAALDTTRSLTLRQRATFSATMFCVAALHSLAAWWSVLAGLLFGVPPAPTLEDLLEEREKQVVQAHGDLMRISAQD